MSLIPVLPLFIELNRQYFQNSLFENGVPRVSVRWSDGRMRTTAGIYRSKTNFLGVKASEIILSRPVLENLPQKALKSTLCHEMIHAWIDLVLKVEEAHGPHFHKRMAEINSVQTDFQVTIRHSFPISKRIPKWVATCPSCKKSFSYQRIVKGAACRSCCNNYFGGRWDQKCVLEFQLFSISNK
ncbi:SprT family zinc-dependent metalloprotease [Prochlorococcus marinus]|uniref:SprT family zinc-dependent metalloprotease n=1 Tax=Prochlorococcus marinus TaxID=1219 RepID=UPI0022B5074F|nr:SprT family zinc-dependent metalloprotease [Prochlorococcus marinus]